MRVYEWTRRGSRRGLVAFVALSTLVAAASIAQGQSRTAVAPVRGATPVAAAPMEQHQETLASLGFSDGMSLLNPTQARDIYFHGTDGVQATEGRLHLDLTLSVHDFHYAFAQVLVNDVPRWSKTLAAGDIEMPVDLSLSPTELSQMFVKVTLRFGGRLNDDRCYDWRSNGTIVAIGAASGVRYSVATTGITTIDGAWSVLPRRVIVAIPAGVATPALYRAAWQTGALLLRAGHTVTYRPFTGSIVATGMMSDAADSGDVPGVVVVVGHDQIAQLDSMTPRDANVVLAQINGRATLVVGDTFPASQFLGEQWRHLAQSTGVRVNVSRSDRDIAGRGPTVTFQQLGLGSAQRDLGESAEWSFPFSVRDLSPGFIPASMGLDVVAGLSPDRQGTVAQVFLNDVLVRSMSVKESGQPQRIAVDLPRALIAVDNTVRLVLQRKSGNSLSPTSGECRAVPAAAPAQVLATSSITGTRIGELTEFLEAPAMLRGGYDVYLPKAVLSNPSGTLAFLARFGADVLPMADMGTLTFYDGTKPPTPTRLFVMVGVSDGMVVDAPARLEHGRLVVDDTKKQPVLDVTGAPQSTVIEVARIGAMGGLLILPLHDGALPNPRTVVLSHGDLAFVSSTGTDLVVDSRAATRGIPRIGVPFGQYRYWAYAFMALLVAIVIMYLLRRVRTQRT